MSFGRCADAVPAFGILLSKSSWLLGEQGEQGEAVPSAAPGPAAAMGKAFLFIVLAAAAFFLGRMIYRRVVDYLDGRRYREIVNLLRGGRFREGGYEEVIRRDRGLRYVMRALGNSDADVRKGAIWALSSVASKKALPGSAVAALAKVFNNRGEELCIRKNASLTLGMHAAKESFPERTLNALMENLDEKTLFVRVHAVSFVEKHAAKAGVTLPYVSREFLNEACCRPLTTTEIGLIKQGFRKVEV